MARPGTVVISIPPGPAGRVRRDLASIPCTSDTVELRADNLTTSDLTELVGGAARELIVSVRRPVDGGKFSGSDAERRAMFQAALDAGARWIDVEWGSAASELADGVHADRVILSDHGAACEHAPLTQRLERMSRSKAARLKLVARADRPSQIVAIRDLLRDRQDTRLCAFALGQPGALTRLLALAWGSWGTYAAVREGAETAPGQFTVAQMRDVFGVSSIRESTRLVALAGTAVWPASPSPAMHHAGYRALEMDRAYLPLQADDWGEVVTLSEALGFDGLAVTLPFKSAAAKFVARGDELTALSAAVNTIVFEGGVAVGFNTDGPAAVDRLEASGLHPGDRIDILGTGGTARAIAAALSCRGHRPRLWSRTPGRRLDLDPPLDHGVHAERTPGDTDWLINATPLRDETLIGAGVPARRGVLDAVYGRSPTALIRNARAAGLKAVDGLALLLAQAERQFELQTGQRPPAGLFAAAGQRHLDGFG